jgi:hypothetical protein
MTHPLTRLDPTLADVAEFVRNQQLARESYASGDIGLARAAEAWCARNLPALRAKMLPQAATQTDGRG